MNEDKSPFDGLAVAAMWIATLVFVYFTCCMAADELVARIEVFKRRHDPWPLGSRRNKKTK